jgi:aspartate/glutamate racemase
MPKTLALIHTVAGLVPMFNGLCDELLPDVKRFHIADEGLLRIVLSAGGLTPLAYRRVAEDALCAHQAGADCILITCSSISPCVDVAQKMLPVPVLKIDEPMADKAVGQGTRIGVLATAPTTLKPTSELIAARSAVAGKATQVQAVLAEGAYDRLMAGDMERHDQIVTDYLRKLMAVSDVVVLAQASMARIADAMPAAEKRIPILSSPRLGVTRAAEVVAKL